MSFRSTVRLTRRVTILLAAAFSLHVLDGTTEAQGAQPAQGGSCTSGQVTGPINNSVASDANNLRCVSSAWAYPVYQLGATSTACNASTAGSLQWTTTSFKGCDGSSWSVLGSGGGAALSGITAATTTSSIDSSNNAITWAWGTLSTQSALSLTTSSMTTGNLLNLSNTSTQTSTGAVLNISSTESGVTYGVKTSLSTAGNTGYAGYFSNSGTSSTGVYGNGGAMGGYFTSTVTAGIGVYGYTPNTNSGGVGVYGTSLDTNGGFGVYGSGVPYGTGGSATSNTGYGIYGTVNGTGGYGVYGTSANAGYGVFGINSGSGYGVYGSNSSTGYAGYFQGKVNVTGALTVGSCTGCGGGASLSGITSATTTASINNTNNAITWAWGTLTSQSALTLSTSSMTSGNLLVLSNTSTQTSTGAVLNIASTEKGKNYGIKVSLTDAANTGYAGYFSTTGSVNGAGVYGAGSYLGGFFASSAAITTSTQAGTGVFGIGVDNGNTAGITIGVQGLAKSTTGVGVYGYADASSGTTYGVYGGSDSNSGYGGFFYSNGGAGGYFINSNGEEVYVAYPSFGIIAYSAVIGGSFGATGDGGKGITTQATGGGTSYGIYSTAASGYAGYFTNGGAGGGTGSWAIYSYGDIGLSTGSYINWTTTHGSGGYGIRDNSGVMEVKDSGGSWAAFSPASGTICGGRTARCSSGTASYAVGGGDNITCKGNTITVTCSGSTITGVTNCPSGYTGKRLMVAGAADSTIMCAAN